MCIRDRYKATEMKIAGPGKAELVFTAEDGTETRELIHEFKGAGAVSYTHLDVYKRQALCDERQ